jgi:hypothetical protein
MGIEIKTSIKYFPNEEVGIKDGDRYIYERYIEVTPFSSIGNGAGVSFEIKENWEEMLKLKDDTLRITRGTRPVFQINFYEFPPQTDIPKLSTEQGIMINSILENEVKGKTLERFVWCLLIEFVTQCGETIKEYFPVWYNFLEKIKK